MRASTALVWAFLLVLPAVLRSADPDGASVAVGDLAWHDAVRNRDIAARVYAPPGPGPFPVIVFSPGLGGSQTGYAYLGKYWAAHGYVSVHLDHPGSDTAAVLAADGDKLARMSRILSNPANLVDRPHDISFAIDQLEKLDRAPGPWQGRLDLARLGVAGHSFGAYTTMAVAGETFPGGARFADPRVKAAVAMSTPGAARGPMIHGDYGTVRIPVFHFTGTEDKVLPTDVVADRRLPFDLSPGPGTYLVVFQGGDHMVFSGRGSVASRPNDPAFQREVCRASTAFWDATLKGDAAAKAWLDDGAFAAELGGLGTFERK